MQVMLGRSVGARDGCRAGGTGERVRASGGSPDSTRAASGDAARTTTYAMNVRQSRFATLATSSTTIS